MATDEEKSKLAKLLQEIEIPDVKLSERCSDLVKDFQQRFGKEVEAEEQAEMSPDDAPHENPYKVDRRLLDEIDRKLQQLLLEGKRAKKDAADSIVLSGSDPKRPWRTNSSKEKLLRIENELKRHIEKASDKITPLNDGDMKELVKECQEENRTARPVTTDRLRHTVDAAKKNLPNFQYRKIENTTATAILPEAHDFDKDEAKDENALNMQCNP
ncbi:uncharacterized protein LOC135086596 [Ostrinia nubilalis]|uniref:uncharacterized protein LOC135086596 n=1 Tax=Ostrinia nubilalis TaxID=29057 RepID=UPI003082468B